MQEFNKVDAEGASLENISQILGPFLKSLAHLPNGELKERIIDNIFKPILENNKTVHEDSDDEEVMAKKEKYHRTIDGGKLPPKTVKEINQMLN